MLTYYINSLSVLAPGMHGLQEALPFLHNEQEWTDTEIEKIVIDLLPANERRRLTPLIKLALKVSQAAMANAMQGTPLASVFASSDGDMEITDKICTALTKEEKPVSPTLFHNSVHNAVSGYWSIASRFQKPSISISAGDATFAAGLLESSSQVALDHETVLYVAYDYPVSGLLDQQRHFDFPFATAMLISQDRTGSSIAALQIEIDSKNTQASRCKNESLEKRRLKNPIAQCLPLLEAIVDSEESCIYLPYIKDQTIKVTVCH